MAKQTYKQKQVATLRCKLFEQMKYMDKVDYSYLDCYDFKTLNKKLVELKAEVHHLLEERVETREKLIALSNKQQAETEETAKETVEHVERVEQPKQKPSAAKLSLLYAMMPLLFAITSKPNKKP